MKVEDITATRDLSLAAAELVHVAFPIVRDYHLTTAPRASQKIWCAILTPRV
jgi:hypothetical protein